MFSDCIYQNLKSTLNKKVQKDDINEPIINFCNNYNIKYSIKDEKKDNYYDDYNNYNLLSITKKKS